MPDESSNSTSPPLTILGKRVISVQRWYRRTSVRSLVFLIFFLVVIQHSFLRSSDSLHTLQAAGAFAILYVLWPFLRGTYLLHQKRTMSLQANYRVADNSRFGELWVHRAIELADLGFKFVACLEKSPDHPLVTTLVAIFVHPENGDSAQLAKIQNSLNSTDLVVFNTRFDDGLVLETGMGTEGRFFAQRLISQLSDSRR